jgi:hypothetical protein
MNNCETLRNEKGLMGRKEEGVRGEGRYVIEGERGCVIQ